MRGSLATAVALILSISAFGITPGAQAEEAPAGSGAVTSFSWATTAPLGDTAARVSLTLLEPSVCSWHFHAAGSQAPRGGPFMFESLANDTEGRISGVRVSSYKNTQVHVGDVVDSRAPVRIADQVTVFPTGTWAGQGWVNFTAPAMPDAYTFTVGGLGLAPTQQELGRLGSWSLKLEVSCDHAFDVDGVSGSHELMLWSGTNMQGGIGVFESLAVDVSTGDRVEREFTTPVVQNELWFKRYNEVGHMGTLTRTTPDGVTTWDLLDELEVQVYDATGPGMHRFDLDRVALDFFSTMGGASYGLADLASLDQLADA